MENKFASLDSSQCAEEEILPNPHPPSLGGKGSQDEDWDFE